MKKLFLIGSVLLGLIFSGCSNKPSLEESFGEFKCIQTEVLGPDFKTIKKVSGDERDVFDTIITHQAIGIYDDFFKKYLKVGELLDAGDNYYEYITDKRYHFIWYPGEHVMLLVEPNAYRSFKYICYKKEK